jgi:hypothetical protein
MNDDPHPYANVPEDFMRVPAFFGLTGLALKTQGKFDSNQHDRNLILEPFT